MYIKPLYNKHNYTFKSLGFSYDTYFNKFGCLRSTQHTTDLRENELNYNDLANLIKDRFADKDKVNIMPMCVSDGTEAYSIANTLIKKEGYAPFVKKYSPIVATDVCSNVINAYGKQGLIHLGENERYIFDNLNPYLLQETDTYKHNDDEIIHYGKKEKLYKLPNAYKKNFIFKTMDLFERVPKINDNGNSVVIIRNSLFQSYGDGIEVKILAKLLFYKLFGKSILITGSYDIKNMPNFLKFLKEYFTEIQKNVWTVKEIKICSRI